jgi:hypothetical protein
MPPKTSLMRRASSSPALNKAYSQLAKTRTALASARRRSQGSAGAVEPVLCVAGGAALSGALAAKKPQLGPVDSRLVAGGGLVAAGLFGPKDKKWKVRLILAGAGALAPVVAEGVEGALTKGESDEGEPETDRE